MQHLAVARGTELKAQVANCCWDSTSLPGTRDASSDGSATRSSRKAPVAGLSGAEASSSNSSMVAGMQHSRHGAAAAAAAGCCSPAVAAAAEPWCREEDLGEGQQ